MAESLDFRSTMVLSVVVTGQSKPSTAMEHGGSTANVHKSAPEATQITRRDNATDKDIVTKNKMISHTLEEEPHGLQPVPSGHASAQYY